MDSIKYDQFTEAEVLLSKSRDMIREAFMPLYNIKLHEELGDVEEVLDNLIKKVIDRRSLYLMMAQFSGESERHGGFEIRKALDDSYYLCISGVPLLHGSHQDCLDYIAAKEGAKI